MPGPQDAQRRVAIIVTMSPREAALSTQNFCRRQLIIHELCVLDLNWTIFSMAMRETSTAISTKPLSDCVTVLCLGQCKSRHLRVCGILKRTCYFQTNWISYILNSDVRCLCCRWRRFHVLLFWVSSSNCLPLVWRTSITMQSEVDVRQQK